MTRRPLALCQQNRIFVVQWDSRARNWVFKLPVHKESGLKTLIRQLIPTSSESPLRFWVKLTIASTLTIYCSSGEIDNLPLFAVAGPGGYADELCQLDKETASVQLTPLRQHTHHTETPHQSESVILKKRNRQWCPSIWICITSTRATWLQFIYINCTIACSTRWVLQMY